MPLKSIKISTGPDAATERDFWMREGTSDEFVAQQVLRDKSYDLSKIKRIDEINQWIAGVVHAGKNPLIIDAGANIGAASVWFALTYPMANIIAIEPDGANCELLSRNTEGLRVKVIRAALSGDRDFVSLVDPGEGAWGYRTEKSLTPPLVQAVCVEDFYHGGLGVPFIVKMDIEGGEASVFGGDTAWIERTPILIVEPHDWMLPKEGTSGFMLDAIHNTKTGRDFLIIGENIVSIAWDLPDA